MKRQNNNQHILRTVFTVLALVLLTAVGSHAVTQPQAETDAFLAGNGGGGVLTRPWSDGGTLNDFDEHLLAGNGGSGVVTRPWSDGGTLNDFDEHLLAGNGGGELSGAQAGGAMMVCSTAAMGACWPAMAAGAVSGGPASNLGQRP
ncbi:MAG: hypothetical protein R3E79_35240 [Caldilineaceae bacterium]